MLPSAPLTLPRCIVHAAHEPRGRWQISGTWVVSGLEKLIRTSSAFAGGFALGVSRTWHSRGRKKPININNFAGLSRKWVGVKLFMCFPFSWEKGKHINKIPRKSQEKAGRVPGQSRDNPVKFLFMCFPVYWFFSLPWHSWRFRSTSVWWSADLKLRSFSTIMVT